MATRGSDPFPALMVIGGLLTLGVAAWALSDKSRYATKEHKEIVDQAVAMALARREAIGRPLSAEEISAFYGEVKQRWNEPLNGLDQKRIWNAARG